MFAVGHAGNSGIAVEHFAEQISLQQRFDALIEAGYSASDIAEFSNSNDGEFVIAIKQAFIRDQGVKLADNSFIYVNTCSSFRWFNRNGEDFSNPSIPWLDPEVGGIVFIGNPNLCYPNADQPFFDSFFGMILGQTPIQGRVSNYSISTAFDNTVAIFPPATANPILATRFSNERFKTLRAYNAPKIIKAEIQQFDTRIYRYAYAGQAYPFNAGPYPGDLSLAAARPAMAGDITISLIFSESMDVSWAGSKVQLLSTRGAPPIVPSNGTWSQTNAANDTWTGTLTIPSGDSRWDGSVSVTVTARDIYSADDSPGGSLDCPVQFKTRHPKSPIC